MSRHHKSDTSSDSSTSTVDAIREICDGCDRRDVMFVSRPKRGDCPSSRDHYREPCRKFDPGASMFTSVITPLSELTPGSSGAMGSVEFIMRRKNKTVTLQWEPFTAKMAASGVSYLTVAQSICNTPSYLVSTPIYFQYKSVGRVTHIEIDPNAKSANIKFFLNADGSSTGVNMGDAISFPGGSATWIVE
ncbi:Hypothetical protein HVR_LOCUS772 [uncultured virus]|nr:Hypothetical protein HVR_LOCUS772 [uncultured virus]